MKEFNINEYVWVKLTEHGHEILRKEAEKYRQYSWFKPYTPAPTDEDGFTKFQAWHLMQQFGPHISLGFDPPFSPAIKIQFPPS